MMPPLKHSEVDIRTEDFDVGHEYTSLTSSAPHAGAVVLFVGLVRDFYASDSKADKSDQQSSDGAVEYIELSHYAGMTETLCQDIITDARKRFPIDTVRVVHRVGKLYAGDQIVLVAVASRHRDAAFQAAQFIMDYLKTRATLWKKEVGVKGSHWLGMKQSDSSAAEKWNGKESSGADL